MRCLVSCTAAFGLIAACVAAGASAQTRYARSTAGRPIEAPVVHVYADDATVVAEVLGAELPRNVTFAGSYLTPARLMLRGSATFRRQCARLAAAHQLQITVAPALMPGARPDQAITRITFGPAGSIQADVTIGTMGDPFELVPHEFEHILEQLDGVDLVSMASRPDTGVRGRQDGEPFETERAIAVGRQVAREVRESRRRGGS